MNLFIILLLAIVQLLWSIPEVAYGSSEAWEKKTEKETFDKNELEVEKSILLVSQHKFSKQSIPYFFNDQEIHHSGDVFNCSLLFKPRSNQPLYELYSVYRL